MWLCFECWKTEHQHQNDYTEFDWDNGSHSYGPCEDCQNNRECKDDHEQP